MVAAPSDCEWSRRERNPMLSLEAMGEWRPLFPRDAYPVMTSAHTVRELADGHLTL